MTRKDISSLATVVIIGLILQVGLVFLDCTNSPSDTAVNYMKAYYKLSPDMSKWLCGNTYDASCTKAGEKTCPMASGNSEVSDHIYAAAAEAAELGFQQKYARYTLSHIKTHTEYLDHTTAEVHLTAHRRRAINPFFVWVATIFSLGETHEVDETIRVELKDGRWLVCLSSSPSETS